MGAGPSSDLSAEVSADWLDGYHAARRDLVPQLVRAELLAALAGIVKDPAAIVEDLNLARFVGNDGEVDRDRVRAVVSRYELIASTSARGRAGCWR